MADKPKTSSAQVARPSKKSISSQISGAHIAQAHRTATQSGTLKTTLYSNANYTGKSLAQEHSVSSSTQQGSTYGGASKSVSGGYEQSKAYSSTPTPTPTPQTQTVKSPTPTPQTIKPSSNLSDGYKATRDSYKTPTPTPQTARPSSLSQSQSAVRSPISYPLPTSIGKTGEEGQYKANAPLPQTSTIKQQTSNAFNSAIASSQVHTVASSASSGLLNRYENRTVKLNTDVYKAVSSNLNRQGSSVSANEIKSSLSQHSHNKAITLNSSLYNSVAKDLSNSNRTVTTKEVRTALTKYQNKTVSLEKQLLSSSANNFKAVGNQALGSAQNFFSSQDGLGANSAGASIEAVKIGATAFKGAQIASSVAVTPAIVASANQGYLTAKTTYNTIKEVRAVNSAIGVKNLSTEGLKQAGAIFKTNANITGLTNTGISKAVRGTFVAGADVTKTVGLSAVTLAQSYNVAKAMNIAPTSFEGIKQTASLMRASAVNTGLASTKIAGAVRGTVMAGVDVTKTVGLSAVTVSQAYNVARAMNIAPTSLEGIKQTVNLVKTSAVSTGLASTRLSNSIANTSVKISNNIANGINHTVTTALNVRNTFATGITTGARGVYQVATTAGKATVTVAQAYNVAKAMNISLVSTQGLGVLRASAVNTGLASTQISKAVISGVSSGVNTLKSGALTLKVLTYNGIQTAKQTAFVAGFTVRGLAQGTTSLSHVSYQLANFAHLKASQGIRTMIKGVRTVGTSKAFQWAIPRLMTAGKVGLKVSKVGIGVGKGAFGIGKGALTSLAGVSDNLALQGIATAVQGADVATRFGVATLKTNIAVGKGLGKAGIKTALGIKKVGLTFWQAYAKTNSIMKALASAGKVGVKGISGALFRGLKNLFKALGKKVLIPILIIIILIICGGSLISAPVSLVGTIFSGIFDVDHDDGSGTDEFEIETYLMTHVPPLAQDTRQTIADEMASDWKSAGGAYDIVRLRKAGGGTEVVEPTLAGVTEVFYTDAEIVDMLEAIFNVKVLMDYDLAPTESQAQTLLEDLYSKIFKVIKTDSTEWCGQALKTGEGEPLDPCEDTGKIHAITSGENTCPHMEEGTHSVYTDRHCCTKYWTCDGHTEHSCVHECDEVCEEFGCDHVCGDDCYSTWYHSNNIVVGDGSVGMSSACSNSTLHNYCEGYHYCLNHFVHTYELELDGLYEILNETFYEPIDALESIPEASRTEAQKEELANLYDYLEIYEIMANEVFEGTFGGGLTVEDLSGVEWVINPSRASNQEVVDLAISQRGNKGGYTYWSHYGFSKRVSWCACFVNWCFRMTPSADPHYPTKEQTGNNAYCQTVANYLSGCGQLGHDGSVIVAGDVIFFDWEHDGHTDHIGIVIGRDNEYVYTVEGNSGDAVKIKKYKLSSTVIYGYGYINY